MSNQFNQRCSKCYQKYSGLKATCCDSSCSREHFFKKNGQLVCICCLMKEGSIKCQKCSKLITCLDEMGKWRRNAVLVDDHTYDINNFGCECQECNHSESKKNKLKRCQGVISNHYNGGLGYGGSTQFNQCDLAVPIDEGDFCQHCKGQTETYQQLRARIKAEEERVFKKFCQAMVKAQNYWDSLSSSEREQECERLVENIKLGKCWGGKSWRGREDYEGYGSGWAHSWRYWGIKNGKFVSETPHLVPVELGEEFMEKDFGEVSSALVLRDYQVVKKDDKDNSLSPNPATSQSITNENSESGNSVNPDNSPKPNPEKDSLSEEKNEEKTMLNLSFENKGNNSQNNLDKSNDDDKVQIINLRSVKQITLTADGNLVIEFSSENKKDYSISQNQQVITSEQINNNQELQKIRDYCQRNNKSVLNQQELNSALAAANSTTIESSKGGYNVLLIGGGIGMVLVVGIVIGLLLKKRKVKKS